MEEKVLNEIKTLIAESDAKLAESDEKFITEMRKFQPTHEPDKKDLPVIENEEQRKERVNGELKTALRNLASGSVKTIYTKSLADGNVAERALTEGSAPGTSFVPEEFSRNVAVILGKYTVINKFTRMPMTSDTMNVPTITVKPNVYVVGEASQITASDLTDVNVQLKTKKIASINPFSNEWLADSYPLDQVLTPVVSNQIAKKMEELGLSGSPTFTKGALVSASVGVTGANTSTSASMANFQAKDFLNMITELESVDPILSEGAEFFMHPALYGVVRGLTATTNEFIFTNPINGNPAMINGYPVYKTTVLPQTASASKRVALFFNPKWIYWGDRAGMQMTIGTEGTVGSDNLFEKDMSALRTVQRADMQLVLSNAACYLECGK